jgi:hypothetical protein
VPLALQRLGEDPLAEGDYFRRDLLENVLRIDAEFWSEHPELAVRVTNVLEDLRRDGPTDVEPPLSDLIESFDRAHPGSRRLSE